MDPVSELKIIARIRSDFPSKFGIPRQSGLVEELKAELVFEPEYRNPEALRGIEGFSHIWLIWLFSEAVRASWSPPCVPLAWAGIRAWACLQPAPRSAQTQLGSLPSGWTVSGGMKR